MVLVNVAMVTMGSSTSDTSEVKEPRRVSEGVEEDEGEARDSQSAEMEVDIIVKL